MAALWLFAFLIRTIQSDASDSLAAYCEIEMFFS
jgi:hypothetical protein